MTEIRIIMSNDNQELSNSSLTNILLESDITKLLLNILNSKSSDRLFKLESMWILINFSYGNSVVID